MSHQKTREVLAKQIEAARERRRKWKEAGNTIAHIQASRVVGALCEAYYEATRSEEER